MSEDNDQDDFSMSGDYSQPFFTDVQNVASPRNSADDNDGVIENSQHDTDMSQSLLQQNHNKRKHITEKEIKEEENTHNNNMDDSNNSEKNKIEHDEVNDNLCIHCTFDKELDKRNYYFGNLLIGELQYLPPCMRSEAYINILNYVQSLKHNHIKKRCA